MGRQQLGEGGIIERGRQGCFLSFLVVLHSTELLCAGNVSICAFMYQSLCVCDHAMRSQSWSAIC